MDDTIPTFNFDYHFSPVPMARSTSDTSGWRTPHQLQHTANDNISRKRDFHQVDMTYSQSYSHSPTPWPSNGSTAFTQQPRIDEVMQVYEPADYCSKLANESGAMHIASKKQRVDGFDESQPYAWSSTYAPNMCVPMAHNVAPSANNMSTSQSTHLSPCSLTSSAAMSRQSSVSSASVTDAFDMMRVESSFSTASDLFPLDQLDGSFISCVTEKPDSRQSTTGLNNGSASQFLSVTGYVGANPFSFHGHDLSAAAVPVCGQQNPRQAEDTHAASEQSISNDAAVDLKASQRRRKHIDNSRQCIAPKRSANVRSARSTKPRLSSGRPHPQHGSTTILTSRSSTKPNFVKQEIAQPKEAISKTPYVRPQHPKLYCNMCEDSNGKHPTK